MPCSCHSPLLWWMESWLHSRLYLPVMLLVIARVRGQRGLPTAVEQKRVPPGQWVVLTQMCVSGMEGAGQSTRSLGWCPLAELHGRRGGNSPEMALLSSHDLPCSLKHQWLQKDFVFLKLFCPWNFLCGRGEERRSNFNNLIYYIICFISWCECS